MRRAAVDQRVAAGGAEVDLDEHIRRDAGEGRQQVVLQAHARQAEEVALQAFGDHRRHAQQGDDLARLLCHGAVDGLEDIALARSALHASAQQVARDQQPGERRGAHRQQRGNHAPGKAEDRARGERKNPRRDEEQERHGIHRGEDQQRHHRIHALERVLEARPPFVRDQHCGGDQQQHQESAREPMQA